ncbi:MAG TPA: DUF4097 family beta strand repeat-containing protein [Bacteroidales bacterium]|nr:DUF4097 family beta strand repeat-containing protein [Bacteroidales bacterium]
MNTAVYKGMLSLFFFMMLFDKGLAQRDQMIISLSDPAARGMLTFSNPKGSVKITGYSGNTLIIAATTRFNSGSDNEKTGSSLFSASEKSNTVTIYRTESNRTIDFDLKIPINFSLKVSSRDNGNVEIININGDIEASNTQGDVILKSISGSAVINSVNGSISASFLKTNAGTPMMLTSLEGSIELFLPEKTNAELKMRSQHGNIFSDFTIKPIHNTGQSAGYKMNPDVGWTSGKLNNGGPEYMISTYNGDIYLKKTGKTL